VTEETLSFLSQTVRLEGRLSYRDDLATPRARVLLCPPHPFLGGDMDSNVLTAINERLVAQGYVVYRFNYRGIGDSETDRDLTQDQQAFWEHSTCPEYESRILIDSQAAMQVLQAALPGELPTFVIGYSFGCLPALSLLAGHEVPRLGLISPPLTQWTFDPADLPAGTRKAFFYSTNDFACPRERIEALAAATPAPCALRAFEDADHFFIGQEPELAAAVCEFLGGDHD
jgi:hypothetical protein